MKAPKSIKIFSWGVCLVLIALAYGEGEPVWSQASKTPSEVVNIWLRNYPHNMERSAELTTLAMRHFREPDATQRARPNATQSML